MKLALGSLLSLGSIGIHNRKLRLKNQSLKMEIDFHFFGGRRSLNNPNFCPGLDSPGLYLSVDTEIISIG